jgi:hypothetical protein
MLIVIMAISTMLSVFILSVVLMSVPTHNVVMPSVIRLGVDLLNVAAPKRRITRLICLLAFK